MCRRRCCSQTPHPVQTARLHRCNPAHMHKQYTCSVVSCFHFFLCTSSVERDSTNCKLPQGRCHDKSHDKMPAQTIHLFGGFFPLFLLFHQLKGMPLTANFCQGSVMTVFINHHFFSEQKGWAQAEANFHLYRNQMCRQDS